MKNKRDEYLEYHFGKYESTSLENRMKITLTKRAFENMIRFYYYVEERFVPIYENGKKYPDKFSRFEKSNELKNELDIDEVLDEFLEKEHQNALNYKK